ncbi:MAG: TatD family hydrolase [Elusimicrobiota bacterium]|jgi:TatD DNase family protein|nr:TatD family hydrolase [Elusimicrobiota bacterium]
MAIDTHTHISDERFDGDRDEVIKRYRSAGVETIFEILCEQKLWDKGFELAKTKDIWTAFAIHPHEAKTATNADFEKLKKIICSDKCIAVGETGLDYHYNLSPQNEQKDVFRKQIEISIDAKKPIIVHCREAYKDTLEILRDYSFECGGVIHSFEGSFMEAKTFIDMGFVIGICSAITFKKSGDLKEVVSRIDGSKILAETDCPYRSPQKFRGQRSEPAFVVEVIKEIANIKNISYLEAETMTTQNAIKLFL